MTCDVVVDTVTAPVVNPSAGANATSKSSEKVVKATGDHIDTETTEVYYRYKADVLLGIVSVTGEVTVYVSDKDSKDRVAHSCEGYIGECAFGITGPVIACVGDTAGEYIVTPVDTGECSETIYKVLSCTIPVNGVARLVPRPSGKESGSPDT